MVYLYHRLMVKLSLVLIDTKYTNGKKILHNTDGNGNNVIILILLRREKVHNRELRFSTRRLTN